MYGICVVGLKILKSWIYLAIFVPNFLPQLTPIKFFGPKNATLQRPRG